MTQNPIDKTIQRTRQYWYIDGLAELVFSAVCLLIAFYFYLQVTIPPETLAGGILNSALALILVGIILLGRRLIHKLKERLTYPRTGFVAFTAPTMKRRYLTAGIAMLMGAIVGALTVNEPASLAWMPAITGLLFGGLLLFTGYKIGLLRFYLLSVAAVLLGPGLSLVGVGDLPGLAWFYGLMSPLLAISGGLTLRSYLKQNQLAGEEGDEQTP